MPEGMKIKIYYEDTDANGVVYHANYLRYMERARTELLVDMGHDPARYHNEGHSFVVTAVDIKFRHPARLGETIEIRTELGYMKRASMMLRQRCLRDETLLAEADVTVAFLDSKGKPRRFPQELSDKIKKLQKSDTSSG
ncbi:hypothetical protein LCGC14_1748990 [marine sediment metagenome]|uniref:Thioesterase domain-containing protein n=1 Tax=marine sediment metagenome TaxID=412755 RepID=A0A0F9H4H9_9ZZZZ